MLLMLGQHLKVWLWNHNASPLLAGVLDALSAAGGMGAPLFVVLAGCGSSIAGPAEQRTRRRSFGRALGLWLLATLLSLLTPSWFSLRSFYILHLMAVALVIAPWCSRQSPRRLLGLALLLALLTPVLQQLFEVPLAIHNEYMSARPPAPLLFEGLKDALARALVAGHFPIFPWIIPFLLGSIAGQGLREAQALPFSMGAKALALGGGALLLSQIFFSASNPPSWLSRLISAHVPFFPCSPALCLALAGIALLLVAAAGRDQRLIAPLEPAGRISLTVLMLHLPIFRELTRPVDLWNNLNGAWTLATILFTMVLTIMLAKLWARVGYKYGAEWLLRRMDLLSLRDR